MFTKAQRTQARLRLALCGPSGSGKTYSALLIAQGLAPDGRIAMIDTERGSGALYSHLVDYDVAPLAPPYTPDRYIERIRLAGESGYQVLIIDSLSHAWVGEGGILDLHDRATQASRSGNSFAAWREVTPRHNALVDALLGVDLHVIVTMRTKTAYDLSDDGNGKKRPIKVGLAPVQRDGLEYEFTVVLTSASRATWPRPRRTAPGCLTVPTGYRSRQPAKPCAAGWVLGLTSPTPAGSSSTSSRRMWSPSTTCRT